MPKSVPMVTAFLVHSIFALVIVPAVAIPRWSRFTIIGITATFLVFSVHAAGVFGIAKRLPWGYSLSKYVFGFYMVTSFFGLLINLAHSGALAIAASAVFFAVFTWLFMRFQSDPAVRSHFERKGTLGNDPGITPQA